MKNLMERFRQGDLPTLKVFSPSKTTMVLVHQQGRSKFFRGLDNEWRAIVNASNLKEALQMLHEELERIRNNEIPQEVKNEAHNILSSTQRSGKLR